MDFVVATILYPLVVAALAVGAGLLVDTASARALPGVFIPVAGLAALMVVAELFAYWEPIAPASPFAVAVVAIAGYAVGWARLRGVRLDPWPIAATVGAYVLVCLPVLLSGRVTETGYLLDTTAALHVTAADYLTEHARNFGRLPVSALSLTMEGYYGNGYPSGGHTLLGATGRLIGTPRLWLYQPFISLLVAFGVPSLYYMVRSATLSRAFAAGAALVAVVPALVYAYAQMGAIKELAALPFILALGPLLIMLPRLLALGLRGAVPIAVVAAAGIGAIGVAFGPWLVVTAVAALVILLVRSDRDTWSRRDIRSLRPVVAFAAVLAVATLVLAVPTFGPLSESVSVAKSLSTSNAAAAADPGNLLRPLLGSQAFGVWLGPSHRVDPPGRVDETFFLIGIVAVSALLGLVFLIRRRLWELLGFAIALGIVWAALTYRGTTWTDAKMLVLSSPIVLLLAAFGVASLLWAGRRIEGALLAVVISFGVLTSNAMTYHDTNLMPTARYQELLDIGDRFAGTAPTLTPDFDEYVFYALGDMAADGPGFAFRTEPVARLRDGTLTTYAQSYDLDQLDTNAVEGYPLIVMRRRPEASRPPANFRLAFQGDYYDVWRRGAGPKVLEHLSAGGGLSATGPIGCRAVARAARRARTQGASLEYAVRPPVAALDPVKAPLRPAGWGVLPEGVGLYTPGVLAGPVRLPSSGRYRVWVKGDIGRRLSISVDGREVGSVAYQTGNAGNYARPLSGTFDAGRHRVTVERGGGSLRPGDGTPGRLVAVVFEPVDPAPELRQASPSDWRSACEEPVDWVEVVRPG